MFCIHMFRLPGLNIVLLFALGSGFFFVFFFNLTHQFVPIISNQEWLCEDHALQLTLNKQKFIHFPKKAAVEFIFIPGVSYLKPAAFSPRPVILN